jgi:uncharacterized LabA/DUF88 family protein
LIQLYYGIRAATGRRYLWLDVEKLAGEFLRPNQRLEKVVYFTSRVRSPMASQVRQDTYIDALRAASGVEVVEGFLQQNPMQCRLCGALWTKVEEKKTDVHIACRMLDDAHRARVDVAVLVSADSDLAPVIGLIRALPNREVLVAFPPRRYSTELARVASGAVTFISQTKLRRNQLPDPVISSNGHHLARPAYWH